MEDASTDFDTALDEAENEDDKEEGDRIAHFSANNAGTVPNLATPLRRVVLPNVE